MIWLLITGLFCFGIVMLLLSRVKETQPLVGPRLTPGSPEWEADLNELTFCTGCGCRHLNKWMGWNSAGQFRCIVCCDTEGTDNERIPT